MNRLLISLRLVWAATVVCAAVACSGSSPTTATPPPPPPPPPALQLTCPDNQTTQSTVGQPIPVSFPAAIASGGTPPTQVVCAPASGTVFPIGTTSVSCTATDSKNVTDKCSFNVTLTVPPKISLTKFVAFGDSMTAGEVVSETSVAHTEGGATTWIRPLMLDSTKAYPTQLLGELQARYAGQAGSLIVRNAGAPGEPASVGVGRLPTIIDGGAYQVLLLMDGVNDFPDYRTGASAVRTMVQYGKRRGLSVYLATVPPENPNTNSCGKRGGNWAFVAPFNDLVRGIAASENVTLVDVNAAFNGDTTTLIDCDGLHPTPMGYQVIADTFFKSIKDTLEVPSTPTSTATPFRTFARPARKSR